MIPRDIIIIIMIDYCDRNVRYLQPDSLNRIDINKKNETKELISLRETVSYFIVSCLMPSLTTI